MVVTTVVTNVLCHDSLTGAIDLGVTEGAGSYTYEWNNDLNDATLVSYQGKDKQIAGQTWHYPSQGECLRCHNNQVNGSLSLECKRTARIF